VALGDHRRGLPLAPGTARFARARRGDHAAVALRVRAPRFAAAHFKEFVVEFTGTGKTVKGINAALRERGIFGGHDLSGEFPELGQSALYAVTEVHTKADIDRLASAIEEVTK
jgi:glycine dehydrogenase subunit 1